MMIGRDDKEHILKMWNGYFVIDPTNLEELDRKFFENPYLKPVDLLFNTGAFSLACVQREKFLYSPVNEKNAWIFAAAYSDSDKFKDLLMAQIELLRDIGIERVYYSNFSPGYYFPGVDANAYPGLFKQLGKIGFEVEEIAFVMEAEIGSQSYRNDVYNNINIENLKKEDASELLSLIENNFPADCYKRAYDTINFGDIKQITVAKINSNIAGYSMYSAGEGKMNFAPGERFGCFEVTEEARSKGIGAMLLAKTLTNMKSNGIRHAYFLWTSERASHIYQRFGFKIFRTFKIMKRKI
ncbi:MAG: GNAT family N-acetyltransferase [Ferroplasma sp.]